MKTLFFFLILLNFTHIDAQTITKATVEHWINGVCCGSGTSYKVSIQLDAPAQSVRIERIIMDGYDDFNGFIVSEADETKVTNFTVFFGTSTNLYHNNEDMLQIGMHGYLIPSDYDGEAKLFLLIDGKETEVIVQKFENLPADRRQ